MYEDMYKVIEQSYNSNSYYEDYRENRNLTETEKTLLMQFVKEMPTVCRAVLDVGCGDAGLFDTYLFHHQYCRVTGIDISDKQIRRAKARLPECKFIQSNFLNSVSDDMRAQYDGILCMYALFNFIEEDQLRALQLMNRCLRKNGVVLINIRKEHTVSVKYNIMWCGRPMYWSLPGVTQTLLWCTEAGFSARVFPNPDNADYVFALLRKEHDV